jgi:hypothetical protein
VTPIRTAPALRTDNAAAAESLTAYNWKPQPEAEALVTSILQEFLHKVSAARSFADQLSRDAGVRFQDLVAEIELSSLPLDAIGPAALARAGWSTASESIFQNPHGIFPAIKISNRYGIGVGTKVDDVVDFAATHHLSIENVVGEPGAPYRWAMVANQWGHEWYVIERHGSRPFTFGHSAGLMREAAAAKEQFRLRKRPFERDEAGFDEAERIVASAIMVVGQDYTCDLFFAAERDYWERRNRAAQVQKARQDRVGIGWANHDHHTYRSSRRHFARLISIFEKLGFHCRERFYAGREAGWGAQVLEQPNAGIVIFADVDLSPDELMIDFAHEPLPERDRLGTVGLWCALHGESFLEAGMHHLECQFDFNALKHQLESEAGVKVMKPFTDFPYLRQAFTEGERWPVRPERIDRLLKDRLITPEQADKFRREGAIGSHLENLERNQGFKGFNQTGVSEIISATDPRKH